MQKINNPKSINTIKQSKIGLFNTMVASGPVIIQKRDGVNKTLLVKHGDKPINELKWKFCGGKLLKGWGLQENAKREAKEEIGIDIKIIKSLPTLELWQKTPETGDKKPELIILVHYLSEIYDKPIKGKGILDMQWFDIDNLPNNCAPNIAPIINGYKSL